jgi:hypothetical protein
LYRSCIFCSAALGSNEVLEQFPVGRSLAFDGWKGRLWAVCPRCRRWNLAPLEERWEAVEEAEKSFRACRVRAHSENVGVARLPDGTRLIRVGEAVPLELATWRHGSAMGRRRRRVIMGAGATILGGTALILGAGPLAALGAVPAVAASIASQVAGNLLLVRHALKPLLRIPAAQSPNGRELVVRQQSAYLARVVQSRSGDGIAVELPAPLPLERVEEGRVVRWVAPPHLHLEGELATRFLDRTLVTANVWSAGRRRLQQALTRLDETGGPAGLVHSISQAKAGIYPSWLNGNAPGHLHLGSAWKRVAGSFRGERIAGVSWQQPRPLPRVDVLALEIALQEESERRALHGELAALEAAWKEAEEIAAIADTLPDDPLDALLKK